MTKRLAILAVDDDRDNANSLGELFEMDDRKVIVAYNGQAAVEAFSFNKVDVGFFDVMMPGKNGVGSFIEIKRSHPRAKVYFMTGDSAGDLLKKAIANGAMSVFGKPMDLPKVLDTLEGVA
jgi:two-component system, OmpR family, alkaline phosphatase synthesis response regulator PhoP